MQIHTEKFTPMAQPFHYEIIVMKITMKIQFNFTVKYQGLCNEYSELSKNLIKWRRVYFFLIILNKIIFWSCKNMVNMEFFLFFLVNQQKSALNLT
jgi:hypothetical protein